MPKLTRSSAISHINKSGALLVFPIKDKPSVPSLWNCFFPGEPMLWEWSDDGDDRVPQLWHLRTDLSLSRRVVYSKWFRNRATFFSNDLFTALLSIVSGRSNLELKLSADAEALLSALNDESPLASKALKRRADLEGRENAARFDKAMKELWQRFLVVAYGEEEEGGYPSLAVGSTRLIFEDLWDDSRRLAATERERVITRYLPEKSDFGRYFAKMRTRIAA